MRKFAAIIGLLMALLAPVGTQASDTLDIGIIFRTKCPLEGAVDGVGCYHSANPTAYIRDVIMDGSNGVGKIFGGLLLAMLIFYGIKLLLGSSNESTLTEIKSAYGQAVAGAALVGGAFLLADTFAGSSSSTNLVHASHFNSLAWNIITFFKALLSTIVLVNIVIQGIRLITATEDSATDNAKKRLLHGMIGAAFVILSSAIVDTFYGLSYGDTPSTVPMIEELVGIAKYVLTIFGALAVIGLIVSGIMLIISVDESMKDRAKKLIIASVVALAVVIAAYGLATIFI